MSDVRTIGLAAVTPEAPIIAELEELLALAKDGQLRGIAHISFLSENNIKWAICGAEMQGAYMRTAGLLQWLARKATDRWAELTGA